MKYRGKAKGKVAAYKAMLQRPGFWQAVERSTAWMGKAFHNSALPVAELSAPDRQNCESGKRLQIDR